MKAVLKVANMNSGSDISIVKEAITSNEGIMACQISSSGKEISIVFDDYFISLDQIIESIENEGYLVV